MASCPGPRPLILEHHWRYDIPAAVGYNIRPVSHYRAPVGYNIAPVGLLGYPGGLLYYPGLLFYLRGQLPGAPAIYAGTPLAL